MTPQPQDPPYSVTVCSLSTRTNIWFRQTLWDRERWTASSNLRASGIRVFTINPSCRCKNSEKWHYIDYISEKGISIRHYLNSYSSIFQNVFLTPKNPFQLNYAGDLLPVNVYTCCRRKQGEIRIQDREQRTFFCREASGLKCNVASEHRPPKDVFRRAVSTAELRLTELLASIPDKHQNWF